MKPSRIILLLVMIMISSSLHAQSKGEMPFSCSKNANKSLRTAWVALGDFKIEEANALIRQVIQAEPDCGIAYASLFTDSEEERRENLKKALAGKLSSDERMFVQAVEAVQKNESSAPYLEPLLKKYPSDYYVQLWAMFWIREPKRAIEIGENIVKRNPKFAPAHNMLGYNYMFSNDHAKAEANFNKYIALQPALANPYDSKGDFLLHVGKADEAITMYEKAVSLGMTVSKEKAQRARSILKFPTLSDTDSRTIKEMIQGSFASYTKEDIDGVLEPYAEQSVEILENQMANIGLVNSRNRLKEAYEHGTFVKQELSLEAPKGNGSIAVAYGRNPSIWKSKESGKEYNRVDNAMFILRRQSDGQWKILLDHFYNAEDNAAPLTDEDKAQITQLYVKWNDALRQGDIMDEENFAAMTELFSAQAVELLPNQRANVGIANLQARWSGGRGLKFERNTIGTIGFEGLGRKAVAWGIGNQDFYRQDSEALTQNEFAWAMMLTKEKDDVWRILAVHWTPK